MVQVDRDRNLQQLELAPDPVGAQNQDLLRPKGKLKATVAAARRFCTYLFRMLKEELTSTDAVLAPHLNVRRTAHGGRTACLT